MRRDGGAQKSPEAFRTISEVASDLDVPQHVLRFWESKFSQVRPLKRGGGRRYYRPDDVDLLRGIRELLYSDGYTIKGVQKLIRDHGVRHVAGIGRTQNIPSPGGVKMRKPATEQLKPSQSAEAAIVQQTGATSVSAAQRDRLRAVLDDLLKLQEQVNSRRGSASADD
ncbi:MAG: MerR family transcriptional regulator [Alphaproteobacteria bacterium]|nr:MerR family transcriptional regulator [Alphaproteobacteria bacterium]